MIKLRSAFDSCLTIIRNISWRIKVILLAYRSDYKFSLSDYCLYLRFGGTPGSISEFPQIQIINQDDDDVKIKIGRSHYFWPRNNDIKSLSWIYQEVFGSCINNTHAYEYGGVKINPEDCVIDGGACEGFFTRYALDKGAKVIALEPLPQLLGALKKSFADEVKQGNVKILPYALGKESQNTKFEITQNQLYCSHIGNSGIDVLVRPLDVICPENRIDFIKMDIEGAEVDAIMGAKETIRKYKPRLSIAVYHGIDNAHIISKEIQFIRSDYHIEFRGIYANDRCDARPMMLYAW